MKSTRAHSETTKPNPLTHLGWVSLVLALASQAAAFQSANSRVVVRGTGSQSYANELSRTTLGRAKSKGLALVSTRLRYRDSDDESTTLSSRKWWNGIFPSAREEEDLEQNTVDEYLEFLDRRYRRLHSDEREEERTKPFSAIDWLLQGSPSRNDVLATKQQDEDALYVLGVAGLASQRLLQKHHKVADEKFDSAPKARRVVNTMDVVDVDIEKTGLSALFIKRIVVPLIRVIYMAQRRKDVCVGKLLGRAKSLCGASGRTILKSLVHGPMATTKAVLEIGGGKKTLAFTVAAGTTLLLLLRPTLRAVVAEGSVRP